MGRQGSNPTFRFIADDPFTWTDLAKEVVYTDDYVLGAPHNTGAGGKVNELYEDLYNRIGYVKRLTDASGNRGYSKNVVINGTRALTIADSGLITVQTNTHGTPPTSSVVLTLPGRAGLTGAGVGYFDTNGSTPYYDAIGAGLAPFMIKGYHTTTGVPLQISVAVPSSPGSPVPGDDMLQRIVIGSHSTTDLYLYSGEYAEFVPMIIHDTTTDLWYLNWTVQVHNSGYQKFTKGGGGSTVTVGASGYPTTNMDSRGNWYEFAINSNAALSYLPGSSSTGVYNRRSEGSSIIYVKVNTSTPNDPWTLTNNGGSPPSGYKPIITPSGVTMTLNMKDGDILVLIEDTSVWRVVSIIGASNNPVTEGQARALADFNLQSNIDTESSARITADNTLQSNITTEASTRSAADIALDARLDVVELFLTKVVNIGDWNMDTDPGASVAHGIGDYKKIRSVSVVIRNDADNDYSFLNKTSAINGDANGSVRSVDTTNVVMVRLTGGEFDTANYDSTTYNRGFIHIVYAA